MPAKKKPAKKASRAVAIRSPQQGMPAPTSPLAVIIQAARDPHMPVDKLERLFAMQREIQDKAERIDFDDALRSVQAEMRPVGRDKEGERGKYATLEKISKRLDPIANRHGFTLSYGTKESKIENHYAITCIVAHRGGHSREYQLDLPADTTGPKGDPNKTKVQGVGSTTSYARRILKTMIFDITIANQDDDGAGGQPQQPTTITAAQVQQLQKLANETGTPTTRVLNYVSQLAKQPITMLQDIPADCFDRAMAQLRQLKSGAGK